MKKFRKMSPRETFAASVGIIPCLTTYTLTVAFGTGLPEGLELFLAGLLPCAAWLTTYALLVHVTKPKTVA